MINPWYFCLDREFNILITDFSADIVLIFSNGGQLLQNLGKRGDFISPTGIATVREGRIIIVSRNPEHCIQLF